jgi:hypothetical protein
MQMIHILKRMVHIEGGNKVLIVLPSTSGGRRQERQMRVLQSGHWSRAGARRGLLEGWQ